MRMERDASGGEGMSAPATRPDSSYLLRKLHSLSGILPVGAFLAEHFWSNSAALVSAQKYDAVSQELQTIPFRPLRQCPELREGLPEGNSPHRIHRGSEPRRVEAGSARLVRKVR